MNSEEPGYNSEISELSVRSHMYNKQVRVMLNNNNLYFICTRV